jgi:hypothetical protein
MFIETFVVDCVQLYLLNCYGGNPEKHFTRVLVPQSRFASPGRPESGFISIFRAQSLPRENIICCQFHGSSPWNSKHLLTAKRSLAMSRGFPQPRKFFVSIASFVEPTGLFFVVLKLMALVSRDEMMFGLLGTKYVLMLVLIQGSFT